MTIPFPSADFFLSLQEAMNADPEGAAQVAPSDAYCGVAIDDQLFVLEFDGRSCSAVVAGGNELDLDFVVAGPREAWERVVKGLASGKARDTLPSLVAEGALAVRSADDDGQEVAQQALPLLQAFFSKAGGIEIQL